MTDQAVDTDDGGLPGPAPDTAPAGRRLPESRSPERQADDRRHPERPAPDPEFLGRAHELRELRADIARAGLDTLSGRKAPRARVLLIAGRPGQGRTALAEELLRRVADDYEDGVLRARLSEPDGTPVPTERTARQLLTALGRPVPPGAGEDELSELLREALGERRVLLLLDDAAGAEQVDALLPDSPDCLVVAVSRGPLTGISDVRPCTVGGLDTASAVALLTRRTGAVRITVDPRAAEQLAEACGGQPAALVLAGGWLAARPKAAVADVTRHLNADTEGGAPLAKVFRLAYAGLPAGARRMLRLLSLVPAVPADPHTASALAGCSMGAARSVLDACVDAGFLHRLPTELPQYEVPGCLQPLLRARAEAEDRPGELRLARARMLERTLRLLQSCRAVTETDSPASREKLLATPPALRFADPRAAADWLRARQPALLAAARLAVADGELDTLARRLMSQLVRAMVAHLGTQAAAPELYGIHLLVLDVAERRHLPRERAAALLNLADLDARAGRARDALARYRAALDAGREAGDPYATGRATESVGAAHLALGDPDRAADWFGRALAQRLARDERADAARLHGRIGGAHARAGRYAEALRSWRSAVTGHRRGGDVVAQARAMGELAGVQEAAGRADEALQTYQEAVELARRAEDGRLQSALHTRLAEALERTGDPAGARLHRGAAERLREAEPGTAPDGAEV
ncbi:MULTISPECIES: tetratricopeptide repeat protein [unclassified Streptomyces]|uniref:tetratricopeptide repeat protein n=1 Tax=unclassified Streptomyces TaxID=2593676 RepID=UPI0004C15F50